MNQPQTIIRPARPEDLPAMIGLLKLLFAIERDFTIDENRQRRGLMLLLEDSRARVLAAEAGGKVVGMCVGQLVLSTAEGGLSLLAEDMVVDPVWRGRGVGRKLMKALESWAREQGVSRMQLLADKTNKPALDFYRRLGWGTTRMICLRKNPE